MSREADVRRRLAESLVELPYETWNFGDSIAFESLLAATDICGDGRYASFVHGWLRSWATRATPFRRLDCTAPGLAMVQAAERFRDSQILAAAVRLADYLLDRPRWDDVFLTWEHSPLMRPYGGAELDAHAEALLADPPAGVFVDCLHFDPPFLVALGRATGEDGYLAEGLAQAVGYVRLLQAPSGLFGHFVLAGEPGTFGPGWGRGQGWALLGLLDVIEQASTRELAEAAADAVAHLRACAARLIAAMVKCQDPDGHWPAVVTDSGFGPESSTAAFMAVGFRRALDLQIVAAADRPGVAAAAAAATTAIAAAITENGTLANVSAAVMACTAASHYAHVPRGFRVPWGQAPALLALAGSAGEP